MSTATVCIDLLKCNSCRTVCFRFWADYYFLCFFSMMDLMFRRQHVTLINCVYSYCLFLSLLTLFHLTCETIRHTCSSVARLLRQCVSVAGGGAAGAGGGMLSALKQSINQRAREWCARMIDWFADPIYSFSSWRRPTAHLGWQISTS